MDSKILCNWLGTASWPPDPYVLLGLPPGEGDAARIEHQVQERMATLRCYQLSHPEEATEGMNRVAQAFLCLTESLSKSSAKSHGPCAAKPSSATLETKEIPSVGTKTALDWEKTPPPVRLARDAKTTSEPVRLPPLSASSAGPPVPKSTPGPADPMLEMPEACRGIRTLPALIERIDHTRSFILAWNQAGKYLRFPEKKLTKPADEADLTRRLNRVFELTAEFPKIVGHPGRPGYRVVAMARLDMTAQMFKMLDKEQRLDLVRDWNAGYRALLEHRRFLRGQFKCLRRRGRLSLFMEGVRGVLNDHPALTWSAVLLTIAVCAVVYWGLF